MDLCRRLDGIPLAIELAAATCRTVGIDDVVQRLDARLDVLLDRRPADGRHASLRGALEWSHDLLTVAEQQLLRRLTVFAGGFELRAVEAICGPLDGTSPRSPWSSPRSSTSRSSSSTTSTAVTDSSRPSDASPPNDSTPTRRRRIEQAHARWYLDELSARPWVDVTTLHPFVPEASNLLARR